MTQKGGGFDKDLIRELAALLEETGLTEIEVEHDGKRIRVARGVNLTTTLTTTGDVPAAESRDNPRPAKRASTQTDEFIVHPGTVTSPMVGTFYRASSPGAKPLVEVGSAVQPTDPICIIEAMKIMNEIESEFSGVVTEVAAQDAHPVEYGQVLFRIDPNG